MLTLTMYCRFCPPRIVTIHSATTGMYDTFSDNSLIAVELVSHLDQQIVVDSSYKTITDPSKFSAARLTHYLSKSPRPSS